MSNEAKRPRIGVPWRTVMEEAAKKREKLESYLRAVEAAGGEPVEISLQSPERFSPSLAEQQAHAVDGILLPGSPADVNPAWYHAEPHEETAHPDPQREQTDFALLDVAFRDRKPVLGICYGCQSLNVYLGGTLIQHIPAQISGALEHRRPETYDVFHPIAIESGSLLERLAGAASATVNTSHHQAVDRPGRELRVTARAPDGVAEAIEYTGAGHWVVGVQWHPEVMLNDALAQALFREFVAAARRRLT
jgi:putative glutamine amidotransferase